MTENGFFRVCEAMGIPNPIKKELQNKRIEQMLPLDDRVASSKMFIELTLVNIANTDGDTTRAKSANYQAALILEGCKRIIEVLKDTSGELTEHDFDLWCSVIEDAFEQVHVLCVESIPVLEVDE